MWCKKCGEVVLTEQAVFHRCKRKDVEEITNDSSTYLKFLADLGKSCDEPQPDQGELTPRSE